MAAKIGRLPSADVQPFEGSGRVMPVAYLLIKFLSKQRNKCGLSHLLQMQAKFTLSENSTLTLCRLEAHQQRPKTRRSVSVAPQGST